MTGSEKLKPLAVGEELSSLTIKELASLTMKGAIKVSSRHVKVAAKHIDRFRDLEVLNREMVIPRTEGFGLSGNRWPDPELEKQALNLRNNEESDMGGLSD
ncbi:hypothetical protein BJ742DRAFT_741068 [Cladochytrium replicatum]|nr:hypothetical protein BJ742DRAFT_741068 [Cladochytrium replicatum]